MYVLYTAVRLRRVDMARWQLSSLILCPSSTNFQPHSGADTASMSTIFTFDAQCCHMGTAIKHPVPDRVKPSFVVFLTSGHSDAQPEFPDVKKLQMTVWHRMLYRRTHMVTVDVKGLKCNQKYHLQTPLLLWRAYTTQQTSPRLWQSWPACYFWHLAHWSQSTKIMSANEPTDTHNTISKSYNVF